MKDSLETKMRELEEIELYMQKSEIDLEEAITKHEQALKIAQDILAYLAKAETRLEKIDMASIGRETSK